MLRTLLFLTYIKIKGDFFGNRPYLLPESSKLRTFAISNREIMSLYSLGL